MIQKASFTFDNEKFEVDINRPLDISIPLVEGDSNPNCFWAEDPVFEVIRGEGFTGSVAEGGSVNYKKLVLTPHGNGTHTECYGHIDSDPEATVSNSITSFIVPAALITVTPLVEEDHQIITSDDFPSALPNWVEALVVRTLPNDESKKTQKYSGTNPPYFDAHFIEKASRHEILHFITDLPSVDPEVDGGKLLYFDTEDKTYEP